MSSGPFNETWLNSSYHETLLPESPWHKIKMSINALLAHEVKQLQPLDSDVNLCILKLLGAKFINEYLTNQDIQQTKLLSLDVSQEVQTQAKKWLDVKINDIIHKLRLQRTDGNEQNDDEVSPDMLQYKFFVHQVVNRGMDRELSLSEIKQNNSNSLPFSANSNLSGIQGETLGHAVVDLLMKHPSQLKQISRQLTGRQLPNTLRQLLWKIKIYQITGILGLEDCVDNLRQEFITGVEWGKKELGILDTVTSSVDGLIRHAVREIYDIVPCIQDGNMRRVCISMAIDALNMLYIHSRIYEAHYALVILPLIWTYASYAPKQGFTSTDLSHMAFLLIHNCFPTRLQMFAIAESVINRLEKSDPILFEHIMNTMKKNVVFDPKEFLVNFIHQEKEKAAKITSKEAVSQSCDVDESLLSNPVIFIRKWIGEGFVGILDFPSILYVWDQCFLCDWHPSVLENLCLVLLELLRNKLLQARDYNDIKTILFNHVYSIHTYDIQQGLVYLNNGGSLLDVNGMRQPSATISENDDTMSSIDVNEEDNIPVTHDEDIQLSELWVEQETATDTKKLTNKESFHVYIDEARFIPDNATVIKVTGRILNPLWKKPSPLDISDVEAYSLLDSPARCPQFHYRYTVHPSEALEHDNVLLLRVYTLDVDSGELVVIGNCALDLYKQEEPGKYYLNTGGHQMRIKYELPSTVSKLSEELFDQLTNIPVISLLIRILPYTEDFIDSPGYSSGFYNSTACVPSETEKSLFVHFKQLQPYPPTVLEAIRDIREEELNTEDEGLTDQQLEQWYRQRMSKQQLERKPARSLNLTRLVQYDQNKGLYVVVEQAFGLPNPCFINVLAYVTLGPDARSKGKSVDGHGGDDTVLFDKRDFNSLQKSPKWVNNPKPIHPYLDSVSGLIIQLYGLDAIYEPHQDRQTPGSVTARKGKTISLVPQGWTVLKLFDKKCVNTGIHRIPLLEGKPSSSFMEFLLSYPCDVGLREAVKQDIHHLQGSSSIQVRIWDGHYIDGNTMPLQTNKDLLDIGNEVKINKAMQVSSGKRQSDIVLQCLTKQERKLGVDGHPYIQEKEHYEEAMNRTFNRLMDDVLLGMGLGPSTDQ